MAREVQIITWCDHCLVDDTQTEATEYAGLNSSGGRVVVDLCDEHVAEFLDPALGVFDTYGRTEAKASKPHRKSPTPPEGRKASAPPGPCPECGKEFGSAQSLGMHRWRKHGVPSQHRRAKDAA